MNPWTVMPIYPNESAIVHVQENCYTPLQQVGAQSCYYLKCACRKNFFHLFDPCTK